VDTSAERPVDPPLALAGKRVAHFGGFPPEPRNAQMRRALEAAGAQVFTITEGSRWARVRQLRDLRPDLVVVGWPGSAWVGLARFACLGRGTPVVLDHLTSSWETSVVDRGVVPRRSLRAVYLRVKERIALHLACVVVVDTQANADFLADEFGIDRAKCIRVWVGADETVWAPCPATHAGGDFVVVHLASYIPLHGMEFVVEAAALTAAQDLSIRFVLIGNGQTFPQTARRARQLGLDNVEFVDTVAPAEARARCCAADLCLGVFGTTDKADRVIPNKVYDALAIGRPVLTGDTAALREVFTPGVDVLAVPAGDARAIADSILWARAHPEDLRAVTEAGAALYARRFEIAVISRDLAEAFVRVLESGPRSFSAAVWRRPER
jgi:glycosyltransferase involved in cell wall biosynthesis